ncbi:phosphopyruvate hydratase [Candidatus Parcubacteria bacterium]|nr:MAG: phosphopyruvate hydratase [Candidatus Parcubacteria bacterium]
MRTIERMYAREILDSRGIPTVEVEITISGGFNGRASVPSGASTGSHEAHELRDNDEKRFFGKGVSIAVSNINKELRSAFIGKEWNQGTLDKTLIAIDGTDQKERLGANAILGVSLAFAHASALAHNIPLFEYVNAIVPFYSEKKMPAPMMNVLNGGKHATHSTDIQEFMIVPRGAPSFHESLRYGSETFHALKTILNEKGFSTAVGDEGGFSILLPSNEEALKLLVLAVERAGYIPGKDIYIALDVAATELFSNGVYAFISEKRELKAADLIDVYKSWCEKYPIISIEDGCAEDDWAGHVLLTKMLGEKIQLVGDDLFVTNEKRLRKGIEEKAANAILIKPNQIGTLTETFETIRVARDAGYKIIISHRSGETEDTTIADIAVGVGADFIKTGSLSRTERIAKYNQLLRIEELL